MQHLVIAMDTTSSMELLLPDRSKSKMEWAIHLILDTIKRLPGDTLISLFLLTGNGYQPQMIGDYPNALVAVKQISSLSLSLQAGIISFWQDLKTISQKQHQSVPWNLLCVSDGDELEYDDLAAEFFEEMNRTFPNTTISIVDLKDRSRQNTNSTRRELPKTAEVFTLDDADRLVETIHHKFDNQSNTSLQNNPLPLNISTVILPLIPVQKDEFDVVTKCLQKVIPYLEQIAGLRYYPATTWLVSTSQMGVLRPPEVKPKGMSSTDALKKFQALFTIIHSFSLNFHVGRKDPRFNDDNYRRFAKQQDTILELRRAAECMGLVFNKDTGITLDKADQSFRISDFSDSPHTIENLRICLQEMARIWRGIASEKADVVVCFEDLYFPGDLDQERTTIPYFDFLPDEIQKLVNELLHNGCWNGLLKRLCGLFEAAIIEWIPLLYRLTRASSEDGTVISITRAAGLYIPEDSPTSALLVDIALACGYPSVFRSGTGGNVVIDLEMLRDSNKDAIRFEKALTSLLVHEHAHAVFAEGINWKHDVGHIDQTDDALTVNESLAEWMELNYWRHDQEMSRQIWNHAYAGNFPEWKYAGVEFVESRFINKGKRGIQALMISLRKGSDNIMMLLQEY